MSSWEACLYGMDVLSGPGTWCSLTEVEVTSGMGPLFRVGFFNGVLKGL